MSITGIIDTVVFFILYHVFLSLIYHTINIYFFTQFTPHFPLIYMLFSGEFRRCKPAFNEVFHANLSCDCH